MSLNKILIIQTAFIGDVILATVVIEKLKKYYPDAKIDFLLRKGNEALLQDHPYLEDVLVWDKKNHKLQNLWRILLNIRKKRYDAVFNLQRFFATGLITVFSGAKLTYGFHKNPLSFLFKHKIRHSFESGTHEVERNIKLIAKLTDNQKIRPKLYPSASDEESVKIYKTHPYICIAPTSVWFTKQWHETKWIDLLNHLDKTYQVYLLGSPQDFEACENIKSQSSHPKIHNLAGKISLLQSASLMRNALINFVNDSAPLHIASSMNAPVCVIYCSTVPEFGYGPLSEKAYIIQTEEQLTCRPCGLHGYAQCPRGHFHCALHIHTQKLIDIIQNLTHSAF